MPKLWNHAPDGYGDLSDKPAVWLLPARALALSAAGDCVQIHPNLAGELPYILEHYDRIGLRCATAVEYNLDYTVAHRYPGHDLEVWLFGPGAHAVRPDQRRFDAVQLLNDKNRFIPWCRDVLDLPVPDTECYKHGSSTTDTQLTLPLFVKGAIAGAGMKVFECHTWTQVETAIAKIDGDFQLQAPVKHVASLGVEYHADRSGAFRHIATTEQILTSKHAYQGTRYPTTFKPRVMTDVVAQAASELGVGDIFGCDVLVTPEAQFVQVECNPRFTGALYYLRTAHRLGVAAWTGINLPVNRRSLSDIQLGPLEFDPRTKTGLVIIGWGTIGLGELGVLAAGTPAQQASLLDEFGRRFS